MKNEAKLLNGVGLFEAPSDKHNIVRPFEPLLMVAS